MRGTRITTPILLVTHSVDAWVRFRIKSWVEGKGKGKLLAMPLFTLSSAIIVSLAFLSARAQLSQQSLCLSVPVSAPSLLPSGRIPAKPVTSGFVQEDLDALWAVVEAKIPVTRPAITTVLEPLPTFTVGPEPPAFRPSFVQYSTQNLTLPKGFKWGVAGAAQQVEGAVKDGGRGPS